MDINVKSRWIDKENSDVVVVTGFLDDLVLFDYCNNASKKSGSRSAKDFAKQFKLLDAGPAPKADMVNHPPHYKDASGIECIEVTRHMQFLGGNCFKYLYRAGKKGSTVEDLKKAAWYAERAWLGSEQVCDEANEKIGDIANHRTGHIQDAMLELADENWLEAIDAIDRELDMLGDTDD